MQDNFSDSEKNISQIKEDLFKLLPFVPIWLTIIGAAKLHYYYRPYKIDIFNYLDFQDVLLFFIDDFYTVVISFTVIFFVQFLSTLDEPKQYSDYFKPPRWWNNISDTWKLGFKICYTVTTSTSVILVYALFLLALFDAHKYPTISSIIAVNIAFLLRDRVYSFFLKRVNKTLAYSYTFYFSFFLVLPLWAFISEITDIKRKKDNFNVGGYIQTEREIINFDKDQNLIGRTKSYSFVFTSSDSCVRVINNSDIKTLFIKNKF